MRYFDSFPGFTADPHKPLRHEIKRLAKLLGWTKDEIKEEFIKCCTREFQFYFGAQVNRLDVWQRICTDLMGKHFPTITKCKKVTRSKCNDSWAYTDYVQALKRIYVAIPDYLDCIRDGCKVKPIFHKNDIFAQYVVGTGKIFPLAAVKENPLLKALLEHIFRFCKPVNQVKD